MLGASHRIDVESQEQRTQQHVIKHFESGQKGVPITLGPAKLEEKRNWSLKRLERTHRSFTHHREAKPSKPFGVHILPQIARDVGFNVCLLDFGLVYSRSFVSLFVTFGWKCLSHAIECWHCLILGVRYFTSARKERSLRESSWEVRVTNPVLTQPCPLFFHKSFVLSSCWELKSITRFLMSM